MVSAPRHVYSALVRNGTPTKVVLEVIYAMPDAANVKERFEVPSQVVVQVPQKLVKKNTVTLTAHIHQIRIQGERNAEALLKAPFDDVFGPVKDYPIEIQASGSGFKLIRDTKANSQ